MKSSTKPFISAQIPTLGQVDNHTAQLVLDRIAPVVQNIARELGMLHARIAQLEQIGPSVKVNYSPRNITEFKEAIEVIRPPDLFTGEVEEEPVSEAPKPPESN